MRYVIDIDGTICTKEKDYSKAKPFKKAIETINKLYEEDNYIVFFTSRGSSSGKDRRDITIKQLGKWGVKYHKLIMGKPTADVYIDDKSFKSVKEAMNEI